MQPYPVYKNSGVTWLGEIPDHWEVYRLGSQFFERREKVSDKDFPALSVTKKGILPQLASAAKSNDGDNRKKVCSGDFVINSRSDRKGSSGVSPYTGSVSLINTILKPVNLNGRYVHNFFRSHAFQEEFYRVGRGIVADLWSTKYSDMRTIMIPQPSTEEQIQIARYLDWQTAKINTFIKAKKKLIALLKEQKQNIINEAVTKGINPNVKMKGSGVEWLGEIPEHWDAVRLKTCITKIEQGWSPQCESQKAGINDWGVLKVGCVNGDYFKASENKKLPSSLEPRFQHLVKKEDIIVSRANTKELVGLAAVADTDYPNILLCDKLYRFQAKPDIAIAKFLVYVIRSSVSRKQIEEKTSGASSSMQNISQSVIRNLNIALPPTDEQQAIVEFIEKETGLIERTIARTEREIELIQEYRTRLVSDVVTGKVDVRNIEIPDFEPVDVDMLDSEQDDSEENMLVDSEVET
jgi:type I restriction enzyme S subunit